MFKLGYICGLFETLEGIARSDPPLSSKEQGDRIANAILKWFKSHRKAIDEFSAQETSALLSTLLPHRRKDRVFALQSASILKVLGRCLDLSASKRYDLAKYQFPGNGDLADCFERILRGGGPPALPFVTLLEVDDLLRQLASRCRFSATQVQGSSDSSRTREEILKAVLLRMTPVEAKWTVRLILKDLSPVCYDDSIVLRQVHFLLPDLLKIHDSFGAASKILKHTFGGYPSQPDPQSRVILQQTAATSLRPLTGLMIPRSEFRKARSIKQCLQLTRGHKWLIDRKYDGEYCQIHIDLREGQDWLRIFSKSGRDSTQDRQGLHGTIRKCLRLGTDKCQIKRQCILVGEMVVYSEAEKCILAFDRIRKHVSRAGVLLGVEQDSPTHHGEHLMIVFFDLLLLDDENIMTQSVDQRRRRLSRVYKKLGGYAMSAESTVLDFSTPDSARKLVHQFAASNVLRHEGLVLKPCGVPYISTLSSEIGLSAAASPAVIKLKKDYIAGLGDEADFAVIGASYSAQEANQRPGLKLSWTRFHLGCLLNETDVNRFQAVPIFKQVGTITMDQCIPLAILQQVNAEGQFVAERTPSTYVVRTDNHAQADVYFREPFVFEVLGSSYSRPSNAGYYMLRHPRVKRMHGDRTWRECITFDQLQNAAQEALAVPDDTAMQEDLEMMNGLESSCKRRFSQMSGSTTPSSATSMLTPKKGSWGRKLRKAETGHIHMDDSSLLPSDAEVVLSPQSKLRLAVKYTQKLIMPTPSISALLPQSSLDASILTRTTQHGKAAKEWSTSSRHLKSDAGCSPATPYVMKPHSITPNCAPRNVEFQFLADVSNGPIRDVVRHSNGQVMIGKGCISKGLNMQCMPEMCNLRAGHSMYATRSCHFSKSVVYVDSSVSSNHARLRQSLKMHGATVINEAKHWDRDSFAHAGSSGIVSESQSFPGLRKMVLVDSRKARNSRSISRGILNLNNGQLKELIEAYDFRLVAALCRGSRQLEGNEVKEMMEIQRHAIGVIGYDSTLDRSVFVSSNVESSAETTRGR